MKYKVLVGTLHYEAGTFSRGDIIDVPLERAALFDKLDIQALNSKPTSAAVEAKTETPIVPPTPSTHISEPAPVPQPVATAPAATAVSWGASKTKTSKAKA